MKKKAALNLTHELFQLMKQFPRPKLEQNSHEGLTRSEYELLVLLMMTLDDTTRALTVSEISSLLQITPAGVTHLINPLEKMECIQRQPAPHDRRVVLIGLTEKGTKVAETLIAQIQEKLIGLVYYLGEEDSQTLIRLMSKTIEFLSD